MAKARRQKETSAREVIRRILLVVSCAVFAVSAVMLIYYLVWEPNQHAKKSEGAQRAYPNRTVSETVSDVVNSEGTLSRFDELRALNDDIKGWITVPNTPIDYPVLQSTEEEGPEFYLYRDYQKNDDRYGSIFLDRSCINGVNSKNVILHGHNMNDGSQFASLLQYGGLDFYRQNPTLVFDDIYRSGTWKVFAVIKVNTLASQGEPFPYLQGEFSSDEAFMEYVSQVQARSLINCPVEIEAGDQILTMSTCSYEQEEYRTAVYARRVREDENAAVAVEQAEANPNPVMPGQ